MRPEPIVPPPPGHGAGARLLARVPGTPALGSGAMIALTVGSALALAGVAWLFRSSGGMLLLGGIVGLLAVAGVPAAQAALRPIAMLGRAARPLGLIVLVFVAAGAAGSSALVQLAVGLVALLIAWYGLVRGEPRALRAHAQAAPALVALSAALLFVAIPLLDALEENGQFSAALFLLAATLFTLAAVLRLISYAQTRLRALVTIAVALALARLGMEGGLLPFHDDLADALPWLTSGLLLGIAGGMLVAAALAEVATTILLTSADVRSGPAVLSARIAKLLETPLLRRSVTDRMGAYGLIGSAAAAGALLLSVVAASTAGGAKEQFDAVTLEPIKPGRPAQRPADLTDAELARTYSPVLVFTEDQLWSPTRVDGYLAAAKLRDWTGRVTDAPPVDRLPDDCPGLVLTPCYSLAIGCDSGADACAMPRPGRVGEARNDEAVYVRVERRGDAAGVPPYGTRVTAIVQYWYFYPYDEWVAPVLGGQFKQRHEGDWEAVTVGLGDDAPLFVAYSQHCGGAWADWKDIRVADSERPRLHPLVAVAEGSQANYRVAEDRRAPDWAKCAGVPADTLTLISYASNIRDKTDSAWSWTPAEHILVTAETPPMSFVGTWGPYSRTTLQNFRAGQRLGKDQRGPATPTLQRLWQQPLRTIFGGGNWRRE